MHTGNTTRPAVKTPLPPVYPRAYGEHSVSMRLTSCDPGLSPCIRGTLSLMTHIYHSIRFIPVHTGNTLKASVAPTIEAVYPRAYGEHAFTAGYNMRFVGLSPCIRGTLIRLVYVSSRGRFIPVHTGNTLPPSEINVPNYGLSPCIRGTRFEAICLEYQMRFIPVHTGNTSFYTYR